MRQLLSLFCVSLFALTPLFANADQSLIAGFPASPLWLSESAITEGDTVRINTVVYDASDVAIKGDVNFLVDGEIAGTAHFSLGAGESALEFAKWKAVFGRHRFSAEIIGATDGAGTPTLAAEKTSSVTATVAKAPPPSAAAAAFHSAGEVASGAARTALPVIGQGLSVAASAAEHIRESGAAFFARQLAENATLQNAGAAGAAAAPAAFSAKTAKGAAAAGATSGTNDVFASVVHGAERVLLVVFANAWLFYPFFALILFAVATIVGKRLARP